MSKSILVIDMPSRCGECPIHASIQLHAWAERKYWCPAANNKDVDRDKKQDWCPLKPMPEKQLLWHDDERDNWAIGYNDCIEDILEQ